MIEELKKQFGDVFELRINMDEGAEDVVAYFKKPDRKTIMYMATLEKTNPLGAKEALMRSTFVGGDNRVLSDDELFLSAVLVIDDLLTIRHAELKKK